MHEITAGHRSLSSTISCVTDRTRFLPVTMTGRFSKFNSISYTEDRHELRVTGTKCVLTDTMSGTGQIFISGAEYWRDLSFEILVGGLSNFFLGSSLECRRYVVDLCSIMISTHYLHSLLAWILSRQNWNILQLSLHHNTLLSLAFCPFWFQSGFALPL